MSSSRHSHCKADVLVTIMALAVLVLWDASTLDFSLAQLMGAGEGFPLRETFVSRTSWTAFACWCAAAVFDRVFSCRHQPEFAS